ncbi:MAG: cytochrome c [Pseudomonadota bacterium]
MRIRILLTSAVCAATLWACASDRHADITDELVERTATVAPDATVAEPEVTDDAIEHGKYMVQLLSCGACHTQGALFGIPDSEFLLAGSDVGIAYTTPLEVRFPAITFPPNLTPDDRTGLGRWSVEQISEAIRHGRGRYGSQLKTVMPWWGYAKLSDSDVNAIAQYLKSIPAVRHDVPDDVEEGEFSTEAFVYFGVYERDTTGD